jgi:hypothetical protein
MNIAVKACKVATRHKRIYHGSHILAHLGYLSYTVLAEHGAGMLAVGAVSVMGIWGSIAALAKCGNPSQGQIMPAACSVRKSETAPIGGDNAQ